MRWHIKCYGKEFFLSRRGRKSLKMEITPKYRFEWIELRNSVIGKVTSQRRKGKVKIPDVNSCLLLLKCTRYIWVISCWDISNQTDLSDKNTSKTIEELPGWGSGKESACQYKRHKRHGLAHWVGEWQPTPVFSSGKSHGRSSLVCYSPWGHRVGHDWGYKY